jgi:hypothetical protein
VDFAMHGAATNAVSLSSARARVSERARGARSRVSDSASERTSEHEQEPHHWPSRSALSLPRERKSGGWTIPRMLDRPGF